MATTIGVFGQDKVETNTTFDGVANYKVAADAIIAIFLSFATIFGNTLTVLSVIIFEDLRDNCHLFVVSLAVSDLVAAVQFIPQAVIIAHVPIRVQLLTNYFLCFLSRSIVLFCCLSSIYNLLVLTVDRYLIISDPFRYPTRMTRKRCIICISVAWLLALVISFVPFTILTSGVNETISDCRLYTVFSFQHAVIISVTGFFIPLISMIGMYSEIVKIVWRKGKTVRPQVLGPSSSMARQSTPHLRLASQRGSGTCKLPLESSGESRNTSRSYWMGNRADDTIETGSDLFVPERNVNASRALGASTSAERVCIREIRGLPISDRTLPDDSDQTQVETNIRLETLLEINVQTKCKLPYK